MSLVPRPDYESLRPEQRRRWDDAVATHGVTHMKQTLLHHPVAYDALMAWYPLRDALIPHIGERGTVILSFAISSTNECVICSLYFRRALLARGEAADGAAADQEERRLVDFGRQVAASGRADAALVADLAERYGDDGLVLLTAFAGLMVATNIVNEVLDVDPDESILGLVSGESDPVAGFPVLKRRRREEPQ